MQTCSGWAAKAFIHLTGGIRHTVPARTGEADGGDYLLRLAEVFVSPSADTGAIAIRAIKTSTAVLYLQVYISCISHNAQETPVWDKEVSHCCK